MPVLINAIAKDWMRADVIILKPNQIGVRNRENLEVPFDHDGIFENLAQTPPSGGPNLTKAKQKFEEFIQILGLLHLAVAREEYIYGVLGVFHLPNLLVDFFCRRNKCAS